jgi:tryptophan-rich sensory protein
MKIDFKVALQAALAILICEAAGIIGSIFTMDSISTWYVSLVKPALNPPSWVFGPVWTLLYALMGIAAFIVWKKAGSERRGNQALWIFGFQLLLNTTWSIAFFGLQDPGLALANVVLLWASIVWSMICFYKISKTAAWLLLPYLLWVSFASYLNYSIWLLN